MQKKKKEESTANRIEYHGLIQSKNFHYTNHESSIYQISFKMLNFSTGMCQNVPDFQQHIEITQRGN